MKNIFTRPLFWALFTFTAMACAVFSYRYFPIAFPLVQLDLKMDRTQALAYAQQLANRHQIGPSIHSQAASFETDSEVKNYVELEAGGLNAFAQMLKDPYYAPYTWHVRHFKEFDKHEATFIFKPDGTPYGFIETISENTLGAAIEQNEALSIAIKTTEQWTIFISDYILAESSKEVRASGRIDHTFIYERPIIKIGQGLYRLKLVVSGNTLTELTHFVQIPEAFLLKYKEMRSANNTIAAAANMAMMLLYVLGGCIFGLLFLMRRRFTIWQAPILWGVIVAFLHALTILNQLPMAWMQYNTALSIQGFLLQLLVKIIAQFIFISFFYGLAFAAAESLTRAAFGSHVQLWRSWSENIASSYSMFGLTIGGYLMVAFDLAFVIGFYLTTTTCCGWWVPSDSLIDPNILASYFPWLSSIVLSLGAGFMEESLFRAVPIAGSALLGERYGNKRAWLITGFIVQALIFGAAHANYPAQPAYARLVELFFFSIINGLIYLRFGLIPAIISHFTYDVIWFSLPLFVSTAPYAWVNQLLVIVFALIPLWVIILARLKKGTWTTLPLSALNSNWQPEPIKHTDREQETAHIDLKIPRRNHSIILIFGFTGLLLWIFTTQWKQDGLPLELTRAHVLENAQRELTRRTIKLPEAWQPLITAAADYTLDKNEELQHLFIWQKGNKKLYQKLLGAYLKQPRWTVRYATFSQTIPTSDRAEEYQMALATDGVVQHFIHQLPEAKPGVQLTEQEARVIAHLTVSNEYHIAPEALTEISATAEKKPNRKDWLFVFAHKTDLPMQEGQARIVVEMNGNEVVDTYRYIHAPEAWEREQLNKKNIIKIIHFLCMLGLYALFCLGFVIVFKQSSFHFSAAHLGYFIALLLLFALHSLNTWPAMAAEFNTSEPFTHQLFNYIGFSLLSLLIKAGIFTLLIACIRSLNPTSNNSTQKPWIYGISLGLLYAGAYSCFIFVSPSLEPLWADYSALSTYLPIFSTISTALINFLMTLIGAILLFTTADTITKQWHTNKITGILLFIISGLIVSGLDASEHTILWLIWGILQGIIFMTAYLILVRYNMNAMVIATSTFIITKLIQQAAFNAFPTALIGNIMAGIVIAGTAWWWQKNR